MTRSIGKTVRIIVTVGLCGFVLHGCLRGGSGGDSEGGGTVKPANTFFGSRYYPLAEGNSWKYETVMSGGQKSTDTMTVVSASKEAAMVKYVSSAFVVSGQYTNFNYELSGTDVSTTGLSYSHCSGEGFTYTPSLPVHLPDSSLGASLSLSTTARVFPPCWAVSSMWTETYTSRVMGTETISVPAGTFKAIRMEGTSYGQNGMKTDFVSFVVDGVGKVKQQATMYLPVIGAQTTESNLLSYSVGGGGNAESK